MKTRRILVVDDDELIREVATMALTLHKDWTIDQASSGKQAIASARMHPPDAILLDVMMPESDGPDTLAQMRTIPTLKHVPVIFLTAKSRKLEHVRYAELDVVGTIAKPFASVELAAQVATMLGWEDGE